MKRTRTASLGAALFAALLLTACSSGNAGEVEPSGSVSDSAESSVIVEQPWAKAADAGGMTGVFGTLRNGGERDLVISGVESSAAEMVELHEVTADGRMQEIDGDVVIRAGESYVLEPGANHIMLMGLTAALLAGDDVTVMVHFDDGSRVTVTAPVKDYAGANESYDAVNEHGAHEGHATDHHDGH